jgi:hypothetical protein
VAFVETDPPKPEPSPSSHFTALTGFRIRENAKSATQRWNSEVGRSIAEALLWLGNNRLRMTQIRETDTPPLVVVTFTIAPPAPKAVEMRWAA